MAIKTLRRRVIIREYDFTRVRREALAPLATMGIIDTLYDRVSWTPLNLDALEKLQLQEILKGKTTPLADAKWNLKHPATLIFKLQDYVYDKKYYKDWKITIDEDGYLCVQARSNTPKSRLGWGVFEKDISRI